MTTLAEINQTLQQQLGVMTEQGKSIERTSNSIESVKKTIASVLLQQKSDRLQAVEDKRELQKREKTSAMPSGFLAGLGRGTGVSWLGDLISGVFGSLLGKGGSLLGMLTGAIGLAAGKLLVWTAIGTLIANFFGDEIKAFVETFKEWTGIDIIAELEKTGYKEEILFAATTAIGALTLGFTKLIATLSARAVLALGSAGLGMLGFGRTPPTTPSTPTTKPQQTTTKPQQPVRPGQTTSGLLDKNGKPLKGTALTARQNALARAAEQSRPSNKLLGYLGRAAPAAKAVAKKIPFIGAAVSGGFGYFNEDYERAGYGGLDRAALGIGESFVELGDYATYLGAGASNYLFGTELEGTDLAGAYRRAVTSDFGSALLQGRLGDAYNVLAAPSGDINATVAKAPNRMTAYDMARKAAKETAAESSLSIPRTGEEIDAAANMFAGYEPLAIPPSTPTLSVPSITAVPSAPTITPAPSMTGSALTRAAANARISAIINNTPVINNITNNNGGGGATSIMTVPVATADTSDRRDIIRRYGR
jgi:hypothetical protein